MAIVTSRSFTARTLVSLSLLLTTLVAIPVSAQQDLNDCGVLGGSCPTPIGAIQTCRTCQNPTIILVGFVGGFVRHDDFRHAEVQLASKMHALYGDRVHAAVFENARRQAARRFILQWLPTDLNGDGSDRAPACVILYGHSWGASATFALARELQASHIPVRLAVEIDSIGQYGSNNAVVPPNVERAINFYQTHGLLHGTPIITAQDPERTRILGNVHMDYDRLPEECKPYPWLAKHLTKGHIAIECDPKVWSSVEALLRLEIDSELRTSSRFASLPAVEEHP